jgi:hypothetical protein
MDVTGVAWRTSSFSGDNGGACVEVATTAPTVAVRDSTHRDGPQLAFSADIWKAFTGQLKATRLDRALRVAAIHRPAIRGFGVGLAPWHDLRI